MDRSARLGYGCAPAIHASRGAAAFQAAPPHSAAEGARSHCSPSPPSQFRPRGSRHSLSERAGSIAAIAMDNSWWQHGHPCAGNLLFHNVRSLRLLLSTWWSMDAERRFGPGGQWGAVGKREQSALWGMLKGHKELRSAIPTLDIKSLWCIPNRTLHHSAFEHSAEGATAATRGVMAVRPSEICAARG